MRKAAVAAAIFGLPAATILGADPYALTHYDLAGNPVEVYVVEDFVCPTVPRAACAYGPAFGFGLIFLNGNARTLPHEKAHIAGMKHSDWSTSRTPCAKVTQADRDGKYKVGDTVCVGFDGSDFTERS